jgi:hypothetical protein
MVTIRIDSSFHILSIQYYCYHLFHEWLELRRERDDPESGIIIVGIEHIKP